MRTRLALILLSCFAIVPALCTVAVSVAAEPEAEGLPSGVVAFVAEVPPHLGTVTVADFQRSLAQVAAAAGVSPAPGVGDRGYRGLAREGFGNVLELAWIKGEAAERGLSVTQVEISRAIAAFRAERFMSGPDYRKFLREAKLTRREARERVEVQILNTRIILGILRGVHGRDAQVKALAAFNQEFQQRWRARTVCADAYVTDRCANGPEPAA